MQFTYQAINKLGATEKDTIEAATYRDAVNFLHQKGLIPVEIKQPATGLQMDIGKFHRVSLQDKILFVQNLSIVMKAGIPLTKGLSILSKQTKNAKFKDALTQIHTDVEAGKSFAEALEKYPKIFPNIFVSMVRVGEISGNLDKNLEYLGIQLQREHELISKTKGAMIYPAVIVVTIFLVGILMSIFVLPKLIGIFKESGMELPLMTRMVIAFTDFMSNHTMLALGGMAVFFGGIYYALKTKQGMAIFDQILLKMPIFGEISRKINMARFSRIMSSMLKSGTPILEGLQISANSMGNSQYVLAITAVAEKVRIGRNLAASLEEYPKLFSYLATQMIGVGEESGNVDAILEELAVHYEQEVDETMRNLSSVIEPVLLLVIGGVVGILAMALISPIYNLTQIG